MGIKLKGEKTFRRKMRSFAQFADLGAAEANLATGFHVLTATRGELKLQNAVDTGGLGASYHLESQNESGGKQYWRDRGRIGSGTYSGSDGVSHPGWIHAPVVGDNSVIVGSNAPHASVTEYGRSPGSRMPPPSALRGWARRHGMLGGLTETQINSVLFAIAVGIKDNPIGAKPAFIVSLEGNRNVHARLQARSLKIAAERVSKGK